MSDFQDLQTTLIFIASLAPSFLSICINISTSNWSNAPSNDNDNDNSNDEKIRLRSDDDNSDQLETDPHTFLSNILWRSRSFLQNPHSSRWLYGRR